MVGTCDKFHRAHGKTQVPDARVIVRAESIFDDKLIVTIDDKAVFISCDEIFVVVRPRDGLDSLVVHIATGVERQLISVPDDDLA